MLHTRGKTICGKGRLRQWSAYDTMRIHESHDSDCEGQISSESSSTVDDLYTMTEDLTVKEKSTYQRLPNELLEKVCENMVPKFRGRTFPLGAPAARLPGFINTGAVFPVQGRWPPFYGMIWASKTTRRMMGIAMVRRVVFKTTVNLSTRTSHDIMLLTQLQNLPHTIRKNVREIAVLVEFSGNATFHAVEQYARIWYETSLLRQRSGLPGREVKIVAELHVADIVRPGFDNGNGDDFWRGRIKDAEEFLDLVRKQAETLVAEENVRAAKDPKFVIGVDITALRERLQKLLATPRCNKHPTDWDWKSHCGKCLRYDLFDDWRFATGSDDWYLDDADLDVSDLHDSDTDDEDSDDSD